MKKQILRIVLSLTFMLGMSACRTSIDSPEVTHVLSLTDYFWPRTSIDSGLTFDVFNGTSLTQQRLATTNGSSFVDGQSRDALTIHASSDKIVMDSLLPNALFTLPVGYHFGDQQSGLHFKVISLIVHQSGRIIAGTSSMGVYYSDDGIQWNAGSALQGPCSALALDSAGMLYAASNDAVYSSRDAGSTWSVFFVPHTSDNISAIQCRRDGTLYLGFTDNDGMESIDPASSGPKSAVPYASPVHVRALAIWDSTIKIDSLYGVIALTDSLKYSIHATSVGGASALVGATCAAFDKANGLYIGGRNQLLTYQQSPDSYTAKTLLQGGNATISAMAFDRRNVLYAVSQQGVVWKVTPTDAQPTHNQNASTNAIAFTLDNRMLLGTDNGVVVFDPSGQSGISYGPPTDVNSEFILLRSHNGSLATGDSWIASGLEGPGITTSLPITARVDDHVDSLLVKGQYAYGDSYRVRYSVEDQNGTPVSPFYWVIYFAKGYGPVEITQYQLGYDGTYAVSNQAILRKP